MGGAGAVAPNSGAGPLNGLTYKYAAGSVPGSRHRDWNLVTYPWCGSQLPSAFTGTNLRLESKPNLDEWIGVIPRPTAAFLYTRKVDLNRPPPSPKTADLS